MPPLKGKGKDARSRVGTPALGDTSDKQPSAAKNEQSTNSKVSYDDILDKYCKSSTPPPSAVLKKIHEALVICRDVAKDRSDKCDKGMRELSRKRKDLFQIQQQQEIEEARAEEERQAEIRRGQQEEEAKARPPAVGARGLAPQDGSVIEDKENRQDVPPPPAQRAAASPTKSSSSEEVHQPRPAPTVPRFQTFGDDPTAFDDPTIYHIRDIHDGLTEDEKKEIFGVVEYPHDDLHDKTAGTPPDRDFSNAKPTNQVSFQHFTNYLEPYVRALTQEDVAFLEERGDRTGPFVIPRRSQQSYKELWAEEDGTAPPASVHRQPPPQPSGSMDQMNDEAAENSTISTGPVLSRLLATMIPERRAPTAEAPINGVNGDTTNGMTANGEVDGVPEVKEEVSNPRSIPPAAQFAEASQPGWKAAGPKMDYATMDQRILQELRHIGFIEEEAEPDYGGHYDDEVAARLRLLQDELRRISIVNGARKSRVKDLATEAMAKQEYSAIADDVDGQINQAYLKRHRNIGKGKKIAKRPGGPGAGQLGGIAISRPGLGEPIKALLEKRDQWRETLGPIVDYGSGELPKETIFAEADMKEHYAREQEAWSEPAD